MKNFYEQKRLEKGQILPMVVLGLIALIGMAALILDGSMVMSYRRTAQSAADAAALAGAEYLCPTDDYSQANAISEARNYVALNNAVVVEPIYFPDENTIHVEASVQSTPFFARIFNQTQLAATAVAEARCSPLNTGHGTLPVAFPCILPEGEEEECLVNFYDESKSELWNMENGRMVLLMDSDPSELDCYDPVDNPDGVICDIDGDGVNDIISLAARGWLSLDDHCDTNTLIDWIDETITPPDIGEGYWLSNCGAVSTNIYHAIKPLIPKDFRVPVYNKQCPKTLPSIECPLLWEVGDNEDLVITGVGHKAYRIVAFGLFRVTCVKDKLHDVCPFREFIENNGSYPTTGNSDKSIEGYFIEGSFPSGGGGGFDYGYYVIHLVQ